MKCLNDVNYKDCVGKVCKSKSSGDFKVLKYNDARNVEVQFLKTGYEATVELTTIKSGASTFLASLYFNILKSPEFKLLHTLPTQSI